MILTWLKTRLRTPRSRLHIVQGPGGAEGGLPGWMARDLGLDDPENRKAVSKGCCRKAEAAPVMMAPKQPRRS